MLQFRHQDERRGRVHREVMHDGRLRRPEAAGRRAGRTGSGTSAAGPRWGGSKGRPIVPWRRVAPTRALVAALVAAVSSLVLPHAVTAEEPAVGGVRHAIERMRGALAGYPRGGFAGSVHREAHPDDAETKAGALTALYLAEAAVHWFRAHPAEPMPASRLHFYAAFATAKATRESLDLDETWCLETSFRYDVAEEYTQFERLVPVVSSGTERIGTTLRTQLYAPSHRTWASSGERSDGSGPFPRAGGRANRERHDVERYDDSEYLRLARRLPRQLLTELEEHGDRWRAARSDDALVLTCDFGESSAPEPKMALFLPTVAGSVTVNLDERYGLPRALIVKNGFGHPIHEVRLGRFHEDAHGVLPLDASEATWWPSLPPKPRSRQRISITFEAVRPARTEAMLLPPGTKVQDKRFQPAVTYVETPVPRTTEEIAAASAQAAESRNLIKTDERPMPVGAASAPPRAATTVSSSAPWWKGRAAMVGFTFVGVLGMTAGLRALLRRVRRGA